MKFHLISVFTCASSGPAIPGRIGVVLWNLRPDFQLSFFLLVSGEEKGTQEPKCIRKKLIHKSFIRTHKDTVTNTTPAVLI